jgi:hypothetical protein
MSVNKSTRYLIHGYTTYVHKALGVVHLHLLPNLGFERLQSGTKLCKYASNRGTNNPEVLEDPYHLAFEWKTRKTTCRKNLPYLERVRCLTQRAPFAFGSVHVYLTRVARKRL